MRIEIIQLFSSYQPASTSDIETPVPIIMITTNPFQRSVESRAQK